MELNQHDKALPADTLALLDKMNQNTMEMMDKVNKDAYQDLFTRFLISYGISSKKIIPTQDRATKAYVKRYILFNSEDKMVISFSLINDGINKLHYHNVSPSSNLESLVKAKPLLFIDAINSI